ncbi:MAG: PAS domain-containing protein [Proteobacteria bacterium]|nr:PAS domain-containing protein [Pseudomonadota bacterium]
MRHPSIKVVFAYWNMLRGERPAPLRTEINPRGLGSALGDVFLLDMPEGRFRLSGSRIAEALGHELTGEAFGALWLDRARESAEHALEVVAAEATPLLLGLRITEQDIPHPAANFTRGSWSELRRQGTLPATERRQAPATAGEMLLLPLIHPHQGCGRVLGVLCPAAMPLVPAKRPRRLDLTAMRALGKEAQPRKGMRLVPSAIAETIIGQHGHLTVFRGMAGSNSEKTRQS